LRNSGSSVSRLVPRRVAIAVARGQPVKASNGKGPRRGRPRSASARW
jgi:hypothetical protein